MQGEPVDVVGQVIGHLGLPIWAAALIWTFYWGAKSYALIRDWAQRRGTTRDEAEPSAEQEEDLAELLDRTERSITSHLDLTNTEHFDQLRRDLTTTIERAHAHTQKETVDAMSRFLAELEVIIIRGLNDRRRPRP